MFVQTQGPPLSLRRPDLKDDELLAILRNAWQNLDEPGEGIMKRSDRVVTRMSIEKAVLSTLAKRDRKATFKIIKRNNE